MASSHVIRSSSLPKDTALTNCSYSSRQIASPLIVGTMDFNRFRPVAPALRERFASVSRIRRASGGNSGFLITCGASAARSCKWRTTVGSSPFAFRSRMAARQARALILSAAVSTGATQGKASISGALSSVRESRDRARLGRQVCATVCHLDLYAGPKSGSLRKDRAVAKRSPKENSFITDKRVVVENELGGFQRVQDGLSVFSPESSLRTGRLPFDRNFEINVLGEASDQLPRSRKRSASRESRRHAVNMNRSDNPERPDEVTFLLDLAFSYLKRAGNSAYVFRVKQARSSSSRRCIRTCGGRVDRHRYGGQSEPVSFVRPDSPCQALSAGPSRRCA